MELQQKRKEKEDLAIIKKIDEYCKTSKNDFVRQRLMEEAGLFSDDDTDDEQEDLNYRIYIKEQIEDFYDKYNEYWSKEYIYMKNSNYTHQCVYDLDSSGNIYTKWIGPNNNPTYINDERVPEDFDNFHPDDERYEDPRIEHLYELFGDDIEIAYNGYVKKYIPTGFRDNGQIIKKWQEIYRPIYPITPFEKKKRKNFPSEKMLRELGQYKEIEWTVLGPNPNYKK